MYADKRDKYVMFGFDMKMSLEHIILSQHINNGAKYAIIVAYIFAYASI